ncbi:MAG: winged helix-turn-helix transcriptional regulator [Aeromicrobium sp.]
MTTDADVTVPVLERQGAFADRDGWTAEGWCRIERALELIGTRSAMVLLREVFYGGTRFEELVSRSGLSEAVAAGRLKDLVAYGLLARRPYQDPGARTRHEYVLTELGGRLFPVFVSLMEWGENLKDDHRTGVELVHTQCGSRLSAEVRCQDGHKVPLAKAAVRIKDERLALRHQD